MKQIDSVSGNRNHEGRMRSEILFVLRLLIHTDLDSTRTHLLRNSLKIQTQFVILACIVWQANQKHELVRTVIIGAII